jgi:nitrous oxidase accessory protein NosD
LIHTNLLSNGYPPHHPGIRMINSSNILIDNIYVYYSTKGVAVQNCTDIEIKRSGMFGCNDGIYVQGRDVAIENCILRVNKENGILINLSSNIDINNVISDGNTAILGVTSGIHIVDSNDVQIRNATCSLNYGYGILVEPSVSSIIMERIEVIDCYIDSNNNGVVMKNIRFATVKNTLMQHNTNGLYLTSSDSFDIIDCNFYKNTYGAFLSYSSDLLIERSEFNWNENGIYLDSTNNSTIFGCLMTNGTWHAITVDSWLELGPPSSNNTIYHNEFRDNGPRGTQVMDNGKDNSWYDSLIGNIWHDHWGPDENNDTIVDEPYMIDGLANASDPFPRALEKEYPIDLGPGGYLVEEGKKIGDYYWIIFGASGILMLFLSIFILLRKWAE